ncbi:prepilin-type N-terminal cleavage/methylation domain-containing protein [Thiohalocapsa marina]|uniref:Prepilin-type N-terminal cleavage/methylation domain-containing protein n=1 Tax=Thiohalocapsa marina TaxID=424902 RepID=A0A5M8FUN0_9GAMM|nr:PilW family protein [Thiohalocapsa marina]KAA6187510.1 prepilin-type N-terminal cleavage/methylation domain-containing protein [Thiohalocapsa marina]
MLNAERRATRPKGATGFSLVELLVALVLGLLLAAGVAELSWNASRSFNRLNQEGLRIENARFALHLLSSDIEHAGFFGLYEPNEPKGSASAPPDPCEVINVAAAKLAFDDTHLLFPVVGYDSIPGSCSLTSWKAGTAILVVRRADTQSVTAVTESDLGYVYLKSDAQDAFFECFGDAAICGASISGTRYDWRRYHVDIYYIRTYSVPGDGIPTLVRKPLGQESDTPMIVDPESIIEGIEDMQLLFGVDATNDRVPDQYFSIVEMNTDVARWGDVVTVQLDLLARSIDPIVGHDDSAMLYRLGAKEPYNPGTYDPATQRDYRRSVLSEVVRLTNVAEREVLTP